MGHDKENEFENKDWWVEKSTCKFNMRTCSTSFLLKQYLAFLHNHPPYVGTTDPQEGIVSVKKYDNRIVDLYISSVLFFPLCLLKLLKECNSKETVVDVIPSIYLRTFDSLPPVLKVCKFPVKMPTVGDTRRSRKYTFSNLYSLISHHLNYLIDGTSGSGNCTLYIEAKVKRRMLSFLILHMLFRIRALSTYVVDRPNWRAPFAFSACSSIRLL